MSGHHIAVLFPGQGVLDTAALQTYQAECPEMMSMFAEADDFARQVWRNSLTSTRPRRATAGHDILIFVASVVAYKRLQGEGVRPRALVGHGFGEIAALVAAEGLTLRDGVEVVARRSAALASKKARHGMAVLKTSPSTLKTFLRILDDTRVSVAVENSSTESVIAGPMAAVAAAGDLARMLGIPYERLKTTGGPHQPFISEIKDNLMFGLSHVTPQPLRTPVYSPLLGRLFGDGDDYVACLAEQLVRPLRFADAVSCLVQHGVNLFIECGPLRGLALELDCAAVADTAFPMQSSVPSAGDSVVSRPSPRLEVARAARTAWRHSPTEERAWRRRQNACWSGQGASQ